MWARTGVLSAFALVLSYLETFIPLPVPIPGAKLGLANIPILMALKLIDAKSALVIAITKTLVTGFLFGSPVMIPYSAAGTLLAFLAMFMLVRVPGLSVVLVSVLGSVFHIVGQLVVAWLMLGTPLVFYTFPLLAVIACVTGALTGKVAAYLVGALGEAAQLGGEGEARDACGTSRDGATAHDALARREGDAASGVSVRRESAAISYGALSSSKPVLEVDARVALTALLAYLAVVLCLQDIRALGVCLALSVALAFAVRVRPKEMARAAGPLLSILVITTVAQVLYAQEGTVVASVGPLVITEEALLTIAVMIVRLACIMLASVAFMRVVTTDDLVEALAFFLRPLKRLGVRVDAFLLSLDLAFQFLPVLLAEFKALKAKQEEVDPALASSRVVAKLRGYQKIIAPLAVRSFAYADEVAAQFAEGKRETVGE